MDAVEYLKAKTRMTNSCNVDCWKCPLSAINNDKQTASCAEFECQFTEQAVEIVESWAEQHPIRTYLSVMLERLPNIRINKYGVPCGCPSTYFKEAFNNNCIGTDCLDCWNREYKEEI